MKQRFFLSYTILLALALCLLPDLYSVAQTPLTARFFSSENGLGTNNVRSIVQDDKGYIWLGTTTGLIRYDAYRTMLITPGEAPNRMLMQDSRIQNMRLVGERYLILLLRGGNYSCYDILTDSFIDFPGNYKEVFKPQANTFTLPAGLPEKRSVKCDNRGNTVVTSNQGEVWHIDAKTKIVTHISNIYSEALQRLNGKPRINVLTDKDGLIWISTYGNGLFVHERETGTTTHYSSKSYAAPIQTDYLTGLYEDRGGNIWVCQENMGVACITKQHVSMEYVFYSTPEQSDHTNCIRLLTNVDGMVYVGNMANGTRTADGRLQWQRTLTEYRDDVLAVCHDKQGRTWVGTRKSGVFVDGKLFHSSKTQNGSEKKVSDMICDQHGRIWISYFDGGVDMAKADGAGGYHFRHFFNDPTTVQQPRQLMEDHKGNIWLTSNVGVFTINPNKFLVDTTSFLHVPINKTPSQSDEIRCIVENSLNQIIVGTQGSGIVVLDNSKPETPRFLHRWTTGDGLPDNNIQQLSTDSDGSVWVGTDHGLARYNPKTHAFLTLMPANTSLGNMFVENAVCMLDDSRLAFGTYHGIVVIDPHKISIPKPAFRPRITDIDINGVSIRQQEDRSLFSQFSEMKELRLNHDQNSLTFYFSDFEYDKEHSSKYSYRLSGYDREWSPLSEMLSVNYKNLPPGHYTFELKVQDASGEASEYTVSMPFVIRPPLWATWWAYLIYICIAAAIGYYLWHNFRRINDLHNRIKVENQLTEYKMRFFTNISHEFRTPLTIIRGAMERIKDNKQMPGDMKQPVFAMQRSTERMLRMIGELMEFSKLHEDKLRLAVEETEVVGFVRDIFESFRSMAETKRINYQFTTSHRQITAYVDRSFIDKIVYNLISNSFKYTPANREIIVKVRQKEDSAQWQLVVEDTGIGIPKDKQRDLFTRHNQSVFSRNSIGIGLHLTGELVRVHHGTIAFQENEQGGCIFTITLPTGKDAYNENEMMQVHAELGAEGEAFEARKVADYQEMPPIPINKRTVLIVEDDSDVRNYLQNELQQYFVIESANDGKEALEKLEAGVPDLIVTDAMMPVMDGFELIRRLRVNSQWADLPIVMLTALNSETDQLKGLKTGAEAYIQKPFNSAVLITTISKMIEQRDRLKVAYAKEVVGNVPTPAILTEEADRKMREQLDAWMQAHIDDPKLTIDACAEHFGYGRTNFFKKVKQLTGLTPNDYIRQQRMSVAIELLKDTRLTVAEVAYKVGFEDQYYFSKSFKSYFGISPSQYRKGEMPKQKQENL